MTWRRREIIDKHSVIYRKTLHCQHEGS
jgi:hypothetical protein